MLSEYWMASDIGEGYSFVSIELEYFMEEILHLFCAICLNVFLCVLHSLGVAECRCEFG
jgi:hypothetical protein